MTSYPYVRVDLRHRAVSVMLNDSTIHRTRQLDDAHLVDVDVHGDAVGIEILALDDMKLEEMGEQFGFSAQVPAIRAAVGTVLRSQATSQTGSAVSYGDPLVVQGTHETSMDAEVQEETNADSNPAAPPIIA